MSIKAKLQENLFREQKPIARWVNVIVIYVSSILCFVCYAVVEFMVCTNNKCENLKIMILAVNYSPIFIVYGVSILCVANYIRGKDKIRVIDSDAMTLAIVIGASLAALLALAIWREAGISSNYLRVFFHTFFH